ncbi:thioredoxin-like protein [Microthyrium microscopicum]|uniref:Thioredoxin-like protein n=1 Tax=Microthyrium microscopicum TaxID=703497 RepID=A0A6A6UVM6_9PEZI|nr:thioredoxin-like protein [Microthyrium microscopicum]
MAGDNYGVTLYTYHGCPYAHRVHIALAELGVKYEEVIIDLDKPREQWYLQQVNPRGLVPALKISSSALGGEHVLIESEIIVQFLADVVPGVLAPASNTPQGAIARARINYFIDTWNTKVGSFMFNLFRVQTDVEREACSKEWIAAIKKEIEPLLSDAKPFFGGSPSLTLAEVNVAPFVLRIYALAGADVLPKSLTDGLDGLPNFTKWAQSVQQVPSALNIWDAPKVVERTKERLERMKHAKQPQAAKA